LPHASRGRADVIFIRIENCHTSLSIGYGGCARAVQTDQVAFDKIVRRPVSDAHTAEGVAADQVFIVLRIPPNHVVVGAVGERHTVVSVGDGGSTCCIRPDGVVGDGDVLRVVKPHTSPGVAGDQVAGDDGVVRQAPHIDADLLIRSRGAAGGVGADGIIGNEVMGTV